MDTETLIERVVGELSETIEYAGEGHGDDLNPDKARRILRAAFAEVRRGPDEKLRELREAVHRAVSGLRDGIVRSELIDALNASALLPPAAEGVGPEAPTAADRAHELRSMR